MPRYLLDTCVVSEATKKRRDPTAAAWLAALDLRNTCLSVLTIGEMRKGVALLVRRGDTQRAEDLFRLIDLTVAHRIPTILPITVDIAEMWADLYRVRDYPAVDCYLAATALVHDLVLVTRNVRDFSGTGVKILNPFEPTAD